MADVSIGVLDNASPILRRLAGSMKDFRKPLGTMGLVLQRSFSRQFTLSGNPRWVPLSGKTIARRRKKSTKPLLDTGRLRRSYITRSGDGVYNLSNKALTIGSNLNYAAKHQYGVDLETVKIPARPLNVLLEDVANMKIVMERWLMKQAGSL